MDNDKKRQPEDLSDQSLDDASGGLIPYVTQDAQSAGITDGTSNITDGTSKAASPGFTGGVFVAAGDVTGDGAAKKIADGSVKGV